MTYSASVTRCGMALAIVACVACSPPPEGESTSPVTLDVPARDVPPPGMCRVMSVGNMNRSCDGIELAAPQGTRLLYRPDDGTRRVVVCYMHTSLVGEIIGVDVFNMDNQRLIETIMKVGDPAPRDMKCANALEGR
jgi:hypothetical protein